MTDTEISSKKGMYNFADKWPNMLLDHRNVFYRFKQI